ncbi:MAG: NAD-dependent epimerase/dehydratase family protein [Acidimicrobiia bacterium]|nr:NAD-dependent epimerase/dehydratase family protein [Acidimicrobiia bacterium]
MRALVTGAAGFAGRHLVEHLRASGDEVEAVGHEDGPDLLDAEGWASLVARHRPEVLYHLAGQTSVAASWEDPRDTFRVNAEGTLVVLLAAASAQVGRVLVVSSSDVYGPVAEDQLPLREEAPLRPATPYGASKAAAEQLCVQAGVGFGLDVLRARAFNHTGPGQDARFVAAALATRVAEAERDGRERIVVGNLAARREFTDVRDVVRAYRLLVQHGAPGGLYNVCSGRDTSIADLAELLVSLSGRPLRLDVDPALVRPVEVPALRGDAARLEAATGWRPAIPFEDTLAALLAEARARVADRASPAGR